MERSGRVGMTVVSVLLGAAVEVGVGSKPTFPKIIKGSLCQSWILAEIPNHPCYYSLPMRNEEDPIKMKALDLPQQLSHYK